MKRRFPWAILVILLAVVCVLIAAGNLEQGRQAEDIRQLELALQRTAVACYAVEGAYPPDVAYMRTNYGLTYDENRYTVHYDLVASNFMPKITVMVKDYEK